VWIGVEGGAQQILAKSLDLRRSQYDQGSQSEPIGGPSITTLFRNIADSCMARSGVPAFDADPHSSLKDEHGASAPPMTHMYHFYLAGVCHFYLALRFPFEVRHLRRVWQHGLRGAIHKRSGAHAGARRERRHGPAATAVGTVSNEGGRRSVAIRIQCITVIGTTRSVLIEHRWACDIRGTCEVYH
jgi:hypothetical protein